MCAVALACCAAAGLAGSAASTPGSQSAVLPDRTVSAPGSTAATGDPQVLARQAYLGMWQAFVAASRTADYQDPLLDHYGSALELLIHTAPADPFVGLIPLLSYLTATELAWWCTRGLVRRFLLTLLGLNVVSHVLFIAYAAVGVDNLTRNGHYIGYFFWSAPLLTLVVAAVALAEALTRAVPSRVLEGTAAALVALAAIAGFAATPLARTSTSYSDPGAPWMSPPDTDALIPGAVATLAARSPGKTLVLNLDHNAWEDLTGFLVQAERRACAPASTTPTGSTWSPASSSAPRKRPPPGPTTTTTSSGCPSTAR